MAEKKPLQQGVESSLLDYYDIMVIGKTGMGKSTTVDKMLIASLGGARPPPNDSSSQHPEPVYHGKSCKLVCDDLTMWLVSDRPLTEKTYDDNALVKVSLRLKNLVFFRSLENSHEEINKSRETDMNIYESTLECELLSNEHTMVRILDIPGFFGREASSDMEGAETRGRAVTDAGLGNMRKVMRIKNAHNLNFKRVVYFLPEKGALRRTDQHLIMELQIMEKHFGRAIFDSMVVITTESLGAYRHANPTSIMFTDEDFAYTKHHLQEALAVVFKDDADSAPEPPVEFISLFDTCEQVLHKIQHAKVRKDSVVLNFKRSFCARCGLTIHRGENDKESSYCTSPDRLGGIAFDESTCHPVMIPKYSTLQKIVGGVLHLVTFRQFVGNWPSFETMDEVCIKCEQPPKSHGCMQIDAKYPGANKDGIVRHSPSAVETYQIEIKSDECGIAGSSATVPSTITATSTPTYAETSILVGVGPSFRADANVGRATFRQTRPDYFEDVKG